MKALTVMWRLALTGWLLSLSSAFADTVRVANTELPLFGLGNAQELRTEVYMGALYLPGNVKSVEEALDESVPKRMTMKILQDNWSSREMVRKLKERIALNNPRAVWQGQGQYILEFASAFQENLRRGDRIDIDHVPGQGVKVYGNGTLLKTVKSGALFNLLLNSWVGDNPPAQSFKTGILGGNSAKATSELTASYEALLPLPNRSFAAVKDEPKPEVKPEAKPEPKVVATAPAKAEPKPAASKPAETKPEPAETLASAEKTSNGKSADSKPAETKTEVAQAETKPAPSKPAPKPEPKPAETVLSLELPTTLLEQAFVDPDLLFGDYKRDAINLFKKNVSYPVKAFREKLQGEGVIRVTVDKRGTLLGTEIVESTGHRLLDREMTDMVNKTMPLPAMPKELPDEPYTIDIPIKFSL